jgi:hypothetical protein
VPAEDRIGREEASDLFEHLPPENLALYGESSPLVVVEDDPLLAQAFP